MIPRARVDVVRADEPIADVVASMGAGHTRYPFVGAPATTCWASSTCTTSSASTRAAPPPTTPGPP